MDRSSKATRDKREKNQRIGTIVSRREKVRAKIRPSEIVGLPSESMRLTPRGPDRAAPEGKRRDLLIIALVKAALLADTPGR